MQKIFIAVSVSALFSCSLAFSADRTICEADKIDGYLSDLDADSCSAVVSTDDGEECIAVLAGVACKKISDDFKLTVERDPVLALRVEDDAGSTVYALTQPGYGTTIQERLVVLEFADWLSDKWKTEDGKFALPPIKVVGVVTGVTSGNLLRLDAHSVGLLAAKCDASKQESCLSEEYRDFLTQEVVGNEIHYASSHPRPPNIEWVEVYIGDRNINEEVLRAGLALASDVDGGIPENLLQAASFAQENLLGCYAPEIFVPDGVNIRTCPSDDCDVARITRFWEQFKLVSVDGDWRGFNEAGTTLWVHNSVSAVGEAERDSLREKRDQEYQRARARVLQRAVAEGAKLVVSSWEWKPESGYAIASGEVRNITQQPLRQVVAVVSYYTASGDFITNGDALIDYDPVMPGQTSPFKIYTRWNPLMTKAKLAFKFFGGQTIPFKELPLW